MSVSSLPWEQVARKGAMEFGNPEPPDNPENPNGLPGHDPVSAEFMVRMSGVHAHANRETEVYQHPVEISNFLDELGVGHFRGLYQGNANSNTWAARARLKGYKWNAPLVPVGGLTSAELRAKIAHAAANADVIVSFEGKNEPNSTRGTGVVLDDWAAEAVAYQQVFYTAVRAEPALAHVKILSPSLHDVSARNSYVSSRQILWTRQDAALAWVAASQWWRKPAAGANDVLMTSAYFSPPTGTPNAWANALFGGYTSIRGSGVKIVLEAWNASARLAALGSLTLSSTSSAAVKYIPIVRTPAGTTRVRAVVQAVGGQDAVVMLGGNQASPTTQTNTFGLNVATKPEGGFRHYHQLVEEGVKDFCDFVGIHRYPSGHEPDYTLDEKLSFAMDAFGADFPKWITETGWHDALNTNVGHNPASEAAAGTYGPRAIMQIVGHRRIGCTFYEFLDDPEINVNTGQLLLSYHEDHFGMMRVGRNMPLAPFDTYEVRAAAADPNTTWERKPIFNKVEALLAAIADPGGEYVPVQAYYRIGGGPANLITLPVQKRDGTTLLLYCRNARVWNPQTRAAINDSSTASATFTLTDGQGARTITVTPEVEWVTIRN